MPTPTTTLPPTLCVVDSDRSLAPQYQGIADRLGLRLQMYDRGTQLLGNQQDHSIGCLIASVRQDEDQVLELLKDISQKQINLSQIVALDQSLASATFDIVGPGTVALWKLPIDFGDLEQLVACAIAHRQTALHLNRKREDFDQTVAKLSDRQRLILDLISASVPNKAIALQLGVSQRTIETDRAIILKVFGAETATDVALRVGEYRLLKALEVCQSEETSQWTQRDRMRVQPAKMTI